MTKYPKYRAKLLKMLQEDQQDIREHSKLYKHAPGASSTIVSRKDLAKRCMRRAEEMLEILKEIKEPTISNVGVDGSQAISVLALHSRLSIMQKVLRIFQNSYHKNPQSVYSEAIPSLLDRVLILQRKKQKFGTQWLVSRDGSFFLYPVEDFKGMNELRKEHGLSNARKPRDLTYGIPKGPLPPKAQESDQRTPTQEEYDNYATEFID
ncbi:MAG TPA: hypothetical protein VHC21_00020 [Candidatus Saccharimonadales bacterium]|nr:hypothetical protein [Candidatus Saccharimonadales bacterium]